MYVMSSDMYLGMIAYSPLILMMLRYYTNLLYTTGNCPSEMFFNF